MLKRTPGCNITGTAFRDKTVDMGIPLQGTSKGMKDTDKSGSKVFRFIYLGEHTEDDTADSREETVK